MSELRAIIQGREEQIDPYERDVIETIDRAIDVMRERGQDEAAREMYAAYAEAAAPGIAAEEVAALLIGHDDLVVRLTDKLLALANGLCFEADEAFVLKQVLEESHHQDPKLTGLRQRVDAFIRAYGDRP